VRCADAGTWQANLKGLPVVGATLVVARLRRVWQQGNHKGRPYVIYRLGLAPLLIGCDVLAFSDSPMGKNYQHSQ